MKTANLEIWVKIRPQTMDETFAIDGKFTFETGNDFEDFIEECIEELRTNLIENQETEDEDAAERAKENIEKLESECFDSEFQVMDWEEVPENCQDIELLKEIAETVEYADWEVIEAAIELGIEPEDIDEAYAGSYRNDEEFAEETADSCGLIDRSATWPQNCIDWEYAAKELMYDYSEENGHYFRNF